MNPVGKVYKVAVFGVLCSFGNANTLLILKQEALMGFSTEAVLKKAESLRLIL